MSITILQATPKPPPDLIRDAVKRADHELGLHDRRADPACPTCAEPYDFAESFALADAERGDDADRAYDRSQL